MIINQHSLLKRIKKIGCFSFFLLLMTHSQAKTVDLSDSQIEDVKTFVFAFCTVLGYGLIFSAILSLKKFGQRSAMMQDTKASVLGPMIRLIIGAALTQTKAFLDIFFMSIWGQNYGELQQQTVSDPFNLLKSVTPMINIIYLIGLIAFIRGWLLIIRTTNEGQSQPGTLSKGFVYVFGGVLAMNIRGTIDMISKSFTSTS
jgi:intracellular multiplication protein IcmC